MQNNDSNNKDSRDESIKKLIEKFNDGNEEHNKETPIMAVARFPSPSSTFMTESKLPPSETRKTLIQNKIKIQLQNLFQMKIM